jgi:hypothetical protein
MTMQKQDKSAMRSDLERRILKGLSYEWDATLWALNPRDQPEIKKPLFSLKDLTTRLGYWSSERGEICLSRNLVMNHSWDSVIEVLRHEMAHQLADQGMGARYETAHGPSFLSACRILRANPKASGAYPALDEQVLKEKENVEDKRLMRIKKLMALAESRNINEAESAMAKAHELIAKYNLEVFRQNQPRSFYSVFLGRPGLRHTRDAYQLARLICDFYCVEGIWISAYVVEKEKMGRVLEISGTRPNIQIAAYVHDFVIHFINSKWQAYIGLKNGNARRKTDFAAGIIEGFTSKMKPGTRPENSVSSSTALMKIDDPLLTNYFSRRYPRILRFSRNMTLQDARAYAAGVDMGKSLVISKGICSSQDSSRLIGADIKPK